MNALLLYLLLSKIFTVKIIDSEGMKVTAVFLTEQVDSVKAGTKEKALPVWIVYEEK